MNNAAVHLEAVLRFQIVLLREGNTLVEAALSDGKLNLAARYHREG